MGFEGRAGWPRQSFYVAELYPCVESVKTLQQQLAGYPFIHLSWFSCHILLGVWSKPSSTHPYPSQEDAASCHCGDHKRYRCRNFFPCISEISRVWALTYLFVLLLLLLLLPSACFVPSTLLDSGKMQQEIGPALWEMKHLFSPFLSDCAFAALVPLPLSPA